MSWNGAATTNDEEGGTHPPNKTIIKDDGWAASQDSTARPVRWVRQWWLSVQHILLFIQLEQEQQDEEDELWCHMSGIRNSRQFIRILVYINGSGWWTRFHIASRWIRQCSVYCQDMAIKFSEGEKELQISTLQVLDGQFFWLILLISGAENTCPANDMRVLSRGDFIAITVSCIVSRTIREYEENSKIYILIDRKYNKFHWGIDLTWITPLKFLSTFPWRVRRGDPT